MHTETVTYLKENANKLNVDEPLMVTQNGKAKYIIQSFEDYQYQQESIALLKLVNLAEKSISEEELSTSDAFDIDWFIMQYKLSFSPVFKITLKRLCNFLARKYSQDLASETKHAIQKGIEEKLLNDPFVGPVCDR